ncbi:phosphate ABC transporter permease subunit PstC [Pseudofrankia sp. BMG5.36]|uniref:phosphate ABC transporter permease subunit PstC n=2 Tax=unclassified Pseudofrankia TaxID=2994372 RepID=UPI0032D58FA7
MATGIGWSSRRLREGLVRRVLMAAALLSVATTIGIVVALAVPTVQFFTRVSPVEFLTGTEWTPLFASPHFGVLPLVTATAVTTFWALLVALPLGLGCAAYLSEYAGRRTRKIFKPLLEILAGVPTVVYGFFALTFLTPLLRDIWILPGKGPQIYNALSAGLVMGIMIIPTVASLSEDAMSAVPDDLRAGARALGSTARQVTTRVTIPAALSGIIAATMLAVSRAVGETMIVAVAAGGTANLSLDPTEPMQTMTAFIAAAALGDQPTGSIGYQTLFAVGSLLFVITLIMNIVSIRLVRRYREVYE